MITEKQEQILAKLFKRPDYKYTSDEDYAKIGIYGENYCPFSDEDDEYYEDDYEEEDDGSW